MQKVGGQQFSKAFKGQLPPQQAAQPKGELTPLKVQQPQRAEAGARIEAGKAHVEAARAPAASQRLEPAQLLDQVAAAQKRMDVVLGLAQSGKSFTPAELISLQSQMYRASQELDLAGKVIEKATAGVKQILQTQV